MALLRGDLAWYKAIWISDSVWNGALKGTLFHSFSSWLPSDNACLRRRASNTKNSLTVHNVFFKLFSTLSLLSLRKAGLNSWFFFFKKKSEMFTRTIKLLKIKYIKFRRTLIKSYIETFKSIIQSSSHKIQLLLPVNNKNYMMSCHDNRFAVIHVYTTLKRSWDLY